MLPYILPLIPAHRVYVEAFAGGAALFFAKQPSAVEAINDINGNVINFYKVMKHDFDALNALIEDTLHCEHSHKNAKHIYHHPKEFSPLDRAYAFWICCNLSFGAECAGSFQYVHNKSDNWSPPVKTKNKKRYFKTLANKLERTTIHDAQDAVELILKRDHEDVFFYLDPPYVGANQGHYKGYTQTDFNDLLSSLISIKGKFLLSSYANHDLSSLVKELGWNQEEITQRLGVQSGKKTEVLTWNYEASAIANTLNILFH